MTKEEVQDWLLRIKADRYIYNQRLNLNRRKQYFIYGWELLKVLELIIENVKDYVQVATPYLNKNVLMYALRIS